MGYSIELYFESGFEEKLRSLWDALDKSGVPSILQKIGSRPHLSLLVLDKCNVDHVADLMDAGFNNLCQFPIKFPALALMPGEHQTIFLTPAVNSKLIEIQAGLHRLLEERGYCVRDHYQPCHWLPHCSISKELSFTEALKTLEVCLRRPATGETWITEVGFIKFRPRKLIKKIGLVDHFKQASHNKPFEEIEPERRL